MDKIYQPVVLYILESDSTKTFYASHVRLKYSLDHENENVHIHSRLKLNINKYPHMKYIHHRNETKWGINTFYSKLFYKSETQENIKDLINSKPNELKITGFLFNCDGYIFMPMENYDIKSVNNITLDEVYKNINEIKEMYKKGYMDYKEYEIERNVIRMERIFREKDTSKKWEYIVRDKPYTCINKRNLGKTQKGKNESYYDKKKSDIQFIYNKNRKQCLRDIKKFNKRPTQKNIDKYKLTESEINLSYTHLN
jgi:hypothetical protein